MAPAEQEVLPPGMKKCPLCPKASAVQAIDNFGICHARKDGHNLYCKACIRKKVSDSRRNFKEEYKEARKRYQHLSDADLSRTTFSVELGDKIFTCPLVPMHN